MSSFNNSTNMSLPIPVVGAALGPDYAYNVNNSLTVIDSHDHSSMKGVPITPLGLNINADLSFNSNNAIALRSLRLATQGAVLSVATDLGCLYRVGVDLYFNDGSGNNIRMTQGGSVSGSAGTITGLPSGLRVRTMLPVSLLFKVLRIRRQI